MSESNSNTGIAGQYQTLVIIWAALLMGQFLFLLLIFFTKPELYEFRFDRSFAAPSWPMVLGFAVAGVTCFLLSFAFKKRFLERAIAEQNTAHYQTGLIIAVALCEGISLIGLCLAFAFDHQYFFLWFALGIGGTILHFPRQGELLSVVYKKQ